LGAIASCVVWPVGLLLAYSYLLRKQRCKAIQAALIAAIGLMLMLGLDALEGALSLATQR